jgi:hypothetical protein
MINSVRDKPQNAAIHRAVQDNTSRGTNAKRMTLAQWSLYDAARASRAGR